jgi:hypothetical protein
MRILGKEATDVAVICCVGDSDRTVYIGLPDMSSRLYKVDVAPVDDTKVSPELARLSEEMEAKTMDAMRAGHGDQEDAPGLSYEILVKRCGHYPEYTNQLSEWFVDYAVRRSQKGEHQHLLSVTDEERYSPFWDHPDADEYALELLREQGRLMPPQPAA